jgi:outer membrane protein assembly factor BamB
MQKYHIFTIFCLSVCIIFLNILNARVIDSWVNFNLDNTAKFLDITYNADLSLIQNKNFTKVSIGSSYSNYDYVPNILVNNDIAYVINSANNLVFINLENKKIIKKISLKLYSKSKAVGMAIYDSNMYISFSDGTLIAYSILREQLIWTYKSINTITSAPTVNSSKVFVISNNTLLAISQNEGDLLWTVPGSLSGVSFKKIYAPSLYLGYIMVGLSSGDVFIVQEDSGSVELRYSINNSGFFSNSLNPVLGDIKASILGYQRNFLIISNYKTAYYSIDAKKVIWQGNYGSNNTPLLIDNYFYIVDNYNNLSKINIITGEKLWSKLLESSKKIKQQVSFDVKMLNGVLFVSSSVGDIKLFNKENGEMLTEIDKPLYSSKSVYVINPPVITSKYILFLATNGNLYIY